jgi:hypothetical protein
MIKVILLVCATSIAPSDCKADNALYFLNGPDATNEVSCAMQSQAYLAQTWNGRSMAGDEYLKIVCQSGARVRLQEESTIKP